MNETDGVFGGALPALYDRFLAPLLFEPYAVDLAERLGDLAEGRLLETAAGTGVVTRALLRTLPERVAIVATDLNQPMLDLAMARTRARNVTWRQADAQVLPFEDQTFDAVVCQFGVMFFPDRRAAYREALRVLRPGGRFVFNTWDRIEENDLSRIVTEALAALFPDDPPRFLARIPCGYHDAAGIRDELRKVGFARITVDLATSCGSTPLPLARICSTTAPM